MTGKLKIVAALLLLAGIVLIMTAMLSRPAAPPAQSATPVKPEEVGFPTVVAKATLPFGEPVQGDMLTIERIPQKQEGTFSDVNDVIGRIPVLTVPQGQKLTQTAFETSPLATQVRPGHRAVAVRIDEQLAGVGRLKPGDIVDVFSVFRRDDRDVGSTQSRQILARLRVITVGPKVVGLTESKEGDANGNANSNAQTANLRNVTLEVPVDDVNLLLLAQQQGNLMLALRNPEDSAVAARDTFPEPVALLKKKEPKDKKTPPEPLSADDKAYAGLGMESVVGGPTPRPAGTPASAAPNPGPRSDGSKSAKKEAREEIPKTEMIRRGKTTSEAAQ